MAIDPNLAAKVSRGGGEDVQGGGYGVRGGGISLICC